MSTTLQHQGRSCGRRLRVVKGTLVLAIMLVPSDHYPVVTDPFWAQVAELATSDGEFIGPVAIDGDTLVGGGSKGAAYMFVKAATGWAHATQTAKLTASDREPLGSVGISGDTVVGLGPTAVYVFVKPASGWANMTETAQLSVLDLEGPDGLGFNVGISGDTVVAGNPNARAAQGPSSGAAYVWVKPESGWAAMTQTAKLTAPDGVGALGVSVSISGSIVVAGATGTGSSPKGAAYVFVEPPTGWADMTQTVMLTPSDGAAGDSFGFSVAISDNTVVAGRRSGAPVPAYVFVQPETGWVNMTQTAS
jgi:FG-GAP repeat